MNGIVAAAAWKDLKRTRVGAENLVAAKNRRNGRSSSGSRTWKSSLTPLELTPPFAPRGREIPNSKLELIPVDSVSVPKQKNHEITNLFQEIIVPRIA